MFSEMLIEFGAHPEQWTPRQGVCVSHAFLRQGGAPSLRRPVSGVLEALLCVDGQLELELDDTRLNVVSPGELLLVSDPAQLRWVHLPQDHATVYTATLPHTVIMQYFQSAGNEQAEQLMMELVTMLHASHGCCTLHGADWYASTTGILGQVDSARRGTYLMLRLLERLWLVTDEELTEIRPSAISPAQVDTVRRVRRYLLDHMDRRLTIADIAAAFNMSPTYLKETFRQVCGQPVHHYLQDCRLTRAARLLRTTEESVLSIAVSVGYSGTSRFNAAFKERYGMSPREFRQNAVK